MKGWPCPCRITHGALLGPVWALCHSFFAVCFPAFGGSGTEAGLCCSPPQSRGRSCKRRKAAHAPRSGSRAWSLRGWRGRAAEATGLRAPWCLLLRERCRAGRLPRAQGDPFPRGAEALSPPRVPSREGSGVTARFGAEGLIV